MSKTLCAFWRRIQACQDQPKRPDRMDFSETMDNDPFVNAGKEGETFGVKQSPMVIAAIPKGNAWLRKVCSLCSNLSKVSKEGQGWNASRLFLVQSAGRACFTAKALKQGGSDSRSDDRSSHQARPDLIASFHQFSSTLQQIQLGETEDFGRGYGSQPASSATAKLEHVGETYIHIYNFKMF